MEGVQSYCVLMTKRRGMNDVKLHTTQAIYANGRLIFMDPEQAPSDGTEVVVTFIEKSVNSSVAETIHALRGRGRGEPLVQKLNQSRREDRIHDERTTKRLRS